MFRSMIDLLNINSIRKHQQLKSHFKYLHLNHSQSTISFSLHRHTHQQSTTILVHSSTTPLPHSLAIVMTLPHHPSMLIPSPCCRCDNRRQIFLLSPQSTFLATFHSRLRLCSKFLQVNLSRTPILFSLFRYCHRLLPHVLSHLYSIFF